MSDVTAPHGYRTVFCSHCGYSVRVPIHCSSRTCPTCVRSRSYRVRSRISFAISFSTALPGYTWKHLVLTIPNCEDLNSGIDLLISSFRRLRHRKFWQRSVIGGFYVLEVTRTGDLWHPHLHIVMYSLFVHWKTILRAWNVSSHVGCHIHINRIFHGVGIANYIAKYVSKPFDVPPEHTFTLDCCTKHRRLFSMFGDMSHLFKTHQFPKFVMPCPKCGNTHWIPDVVMDIYKHRLRD